MENRFKCRYEVQDGYIGGSRPQTFSIDESSIESDMDEEALRNLFEELMQEDFEKRVYPGQINKSDFLGWARQVIEARKE